MNTTPLRLGFPVKVLGTSVKSNDSRRWRNRPHLKVSLEYVSQILDYLAEQRISMYRLSSDLAPYATHPDMPQFHGMVAESDPELRAFGRKARELGIRLSFHPSQFVLLNSPDQQLTAKSVWDLTSQAEMLDRMELGPEAVMVTHVGGVYGDLVESRMRWASRWPTLPEPVRRRLVLEHDDIRFSAADVLWVHEHTGVRCVFDYQHYWCLNRERLNMREVLVRMLATWPEGQRPKLHFSSPRMEMRELDRVDRRTGKKTRALVPPLLTGHSDFTNPFEFARFMRDAEGLDFDVMLEGKAKDLALLKLRADLLRLAPDVASRFGLKPQDVVLSAEAQMMEDPGELDDADPDEGGPPLPGESTRPGP
jgi:UV DNA damage endonuclease